MEDVQKFHTISHCLTIIMLSVLDLKKNHLYFVIFSEKQKMRELSWHSMNRKTVERQQRQLTFHVANYRDISSVKLLLRVKVKDECSL